MGGVCDDDADDGEDDDYNTEADDGADGDLLFPGTLDDPEEFPGQDDDEGVGDDVDCGAHSETDERKLDILIRLTTPYQRTGQWIPFLSFRRDLSYLE